MVRSGIACVRDLELFVTQNYRLMYYSTETTRLGVVVMIQIYTLLDFWPVSIQSS